MKKHGLLLLASIAMVLTWCTPQASTPTPWNTNTTDPSIPLVTTIDYQSYQATGSSDAPVTFIEFSDYECPFCKKFTTETLPTLLESYVASWLVQFVFMDFPLEIHPEWVPSAIAAHCAWEQWSYFAYHDALFENSTALWQTLYHSLAEELWLDVTAFSLCLSNPQIVQRVNESIRIAQNIDINGTPSFLINDTVVKWARSREYFKEIIDGYLNWDAPTSWSISNNGNISCTSDDDCEAPRTYWPYCSRTNPKEVCLTKSVPTCQEAGTAISECVTMITESCSPCPFDTTCLKGVCRESE